MKRLTALILILLLLTSCAAPAEKIETAAPEIEGTPATGSIEFLLVGNDGNDKYYDKSNATRIDNSPLSGKKIYWLGSSVTYGSGSNGQSLAHFLTETDGAVCTVDAVSGTTLATYDEGGEKSYVSRLVNGEKLKPEEKIDLFVCQISTNDCKDENMEHFGSLSDGFDDFDLSTAAGSVEYVIKYVAETWGCPIVFFSGSWFGDDGARSSQSPSGTNYAKLVALTKEAAEKWGGHGVKVSVIDLYNDAEFNALVSDDDYAYLMRDAIHPRKAGYLVWWLPKVRESLYEVFS